MSSNCQKYVTERKPNGEVIVRPSKRKDYRTRRTTPMTNAEILRNCDARGFWRTEITPMAKFLPSNRPDKYCAEGVGEQDLLARIERAMGC